MNVTDLHAYRQHKIKELRAEQNRLLEEARRLIDEAAAEDSYNYDKSAESLKMTDKAVELHAKIRELESKTS